MLTDLEVQNYRSLQHVVVPKLGRVNLIVGKNNSGKSTVLESLRVLAKNGNPALLDELIIEHDEYFSSQTEGGAALMDEDQGLFALRNLFHGRNLPDAGTGSIYIGTTDKSEYVRVDHRLFTYETVEVKDEQGETMVIRRRKIHENGGGLFPEPLLQHALVVSSSRTERTQLIDLSSREEFRRRPATYDAERDTAISYVPTQFITPDRLAQLWDTIALTDAEATVTKALMVIEPAVQGLAFVRRASTRSQYQYRVRRTTSERSPIIKLSGVRTPLPLNSMGDGMSRVLQIVMSAFASRNGYFLIDEFENGLHYSIQQQVWELIFRLAEELNSQVFATTHSWDCIKAFRDAAKASSESGVLFRLGRSVKKDDHHRLIATIFDEEALWKITQADIEVR